MGRKRAKAADWLILALLLAVGIHALMAQAQDELIIEPPGEFVPVSETEVKYVLDGMTTREKVAQLFFITQDDLVGGYGVTAAGETTERCFSDYPVGGIIYMEPNIQTWEQTEEMLRNMQQISKDYWKGRGDIPVFLAVDEEGGSVTRVANRGIGNIPDIPAMASVGATGSREEAYVTGAKIGDYLSELHFNVDFAPVADVCSSGDNWVIGDRSFGPDPALTADMVGEVVDGLHSEGIYATLKHFPGHGSTDEDSHYGTAYCWKSLEELRGCEFLPFKAGIERGADFVMAGHISVPAVTGSEGPPASLSRTMITDILRGELGFSGIVITDALNMSAVTQLYSSGDAAVKALEAGVDMLLMPASFHDAYEGVCSAVESGRITEERLDESVSRILRLKLSRYIC